MSLRSLNNQILSSFGSVALRFEQNKTVKAITDGLINLIPIVFIGSVFLAISNLPIPGFHDFLDGVTGENWTLINNMISFATEDIIALAALISVALALSTQSCFMQRHEIGSFFPVFTAFACYVVLLVWDPQSYAAVTQSGAPEVLFTNPGRNGVFGALFVALIAVKLFIVFARLWQKVPGFHWRVMGSYQAVRISIRAVVPLACTLICFIVLRFCMDWVFSNTHLQQGFNEIVTNIVNDGSLSAVVLSVLMMQVLWFFGAHGSNTIQSYMNQATPDSSAVIESGAIDPTQMFSNPDFYSIFIDMGGSGTGMALLLALALFGSLNRGKRLARISLFPVAFNINETLLFGVPVVLSPFFVIPFILSPVVVALVAYGALSLGIVPPMVNFVEWTTPILFSGYIATGSIGGTLLQLVCVGLAFLIYAPFVVAAKGIRNKARLELFEVFKREASCAANNEQPPLANRRDAIGEMARDFITELNLQFEQERIPFHLVYQPKTDAKGHVVGAEALLRGTHPLYGPVPPDCLIELTDEAELSTPLGRWILTQALEEQKRWQSQGLNQLMISINLNPHHLYLDSEFPAYVKEELERLKLDPALVELEITEHIAIHASNNMLDLFAHLRDVGVELSIDDMGMGYSSLTYISDFGVGVVKLDVSLVDKVTTDVQQQEIVRSIIELAKQINLAVIVEGVETKEQVTTLESLGCRYFQGYYFSKPLLPEEFMHFVEQQGTAVLQHENL